MTVRILVGDVRDRLAELPDQSVQCVVTSPPYFGLRDYGTAQWDGGDPACDHKGTLKTTSNGFNARYFGKDYHGEKQDEMRREIHRTSCPKCGATRIDQQIGLEPTLAEYVETLVQVFREVRRVLRDDGTLWLNIGDSYAAGKMGRDDDGPADLARRAALYGTGVPKAAAKGANGAQRKPTDGLKPKDLMMVPARVALALQDDGWYLRSDVIWAKPNPMPESVTDRPTSSHEHIFLLTKQSRYFWDADAIREGVTGNAHARGNGVNPKAELSAVGSKQNASFSAAVNELVTNRNARNVWTIATAPYKEAHFATFPPELPRRCILAGTSEKGACPACGAPWVRCVERETNWQERKANGADSGSMHNGHNASHGAGMSHDLYANRKTLGWQPSCACDAGPPVPQTILDPFAGAGTTLLVADQLGRDAVGIELNPEYARLIERRVRDDAPLFAEIETVPVLAQGALL